MRFDHRHGGGALVDVGEVRQYGGDRGKKPASQMAGQGKDIPRAENQWCWCRVALVSGNEAANRAFVDGLVCISDFLSPDVVVVDHRMTTTAEAGPVLYSGMIALAHAVETAMSTSANPMIDAYTYGAIRLLIENLPAAVRKPSNKKNSVAVANAGALAATAFSNAPEGIAHHLAEALADCTGINRGSVWDC